MIVNHKVVVELKSVTQMHPVYHKQLLTYLKLMRLPVGLLINVGDVTLKKGLTRVVNTYRPPCLSASARNSVGQIARPHEMAKGIVGKLRSGHAMTVGGGYHIPAPR